MGNDLRDIGGEPEPLDVAKLTRRLRSGPQTLVELAVLLQTTQGIVLDALLAIKEKGGNLLDIGGTYQLLRTPIMGTDDEAIFLRESDAKGWHRFGVISDTHLCSKYQRMDVVESLYDWYAGEGITEVYHCGNWIDGEHRFNKMDLLPEGHGMQSQLDYFCAQYPRRRGITTRYVAGDDHEGWYSQRECVDIGQLLLDTAARAGRDDLEYLGYKEAYVTLAHKNSGETSRLLVDHPGGGSAYAHSYAAQKRVAGLQSGEKPGMWIFGHWHKLGYFVSRGVHILLAGCCKDLDPFGRKKGLEYHVGGSIMEVRQGQQGAMEEVVPRIRQYFDRNYYIGGFNPAGPLKKRRSPSGKKRRARSGQGTGPKA